MRGMDHGRGVAVTASFGAQHHRDMLAVQHHYQARERRGEREDRPAGRGQIERRRRAGACEQQRARRPLAKIASGHAASSPITSAPAAASWTSAGG